MVKLAGSAFIFALGTALVALVLPTAAQAGPISIQESTSPISLTGFDALNVNKGALGSAASFTAGEYTVSFHGLASNQGVVKGTVPGEYAAPVTNMAGATYTGKYLSTGDTGYIDISLAHQRTAIALLWGSIDLTNQVKFFEGTQQVGVVTGADIDAAANGSLGAGGSDYVVLISAVDFNSIQLSSGVYSFELAELEAARDPTNVHEPASFALLGAGLLSLATLRRRP